MRELREDLGQAAATGVVGLGSEKARVGIQVTVSRGGLGRESDGSAPGVVQG